MGIADDLARHNADLRRHELEKSRHDLLHVGPPPSEAGEVVPAVPGGIEAGRSRGHGDEREAGAGVTVVRMVQVDMTHTMLVRLPADEAEVVLADGADYTDLAERVTRWQRIAHYARIGGYFEISDASDVPLDDWTWPEPVDGVDGKPGYLWSARHFVESARSELWAGRYREGHCPELDEVNNALGRLEERLRLMALAADAARAQQVAG